MGKGDVQNPATDGRVNNKSGNQGQGREDRDNKNESQRSKNDDSYSTDMDE